MSWVGLAELEEEARRRVSPIISDYIAGGADDEVTRRSNERAFRRVGLVPRVLTGAGNPDLSTELLGQRLSMPVLLAPTAFHKLVHHEGEVATARAARNADTVLIAAMAGTVSIAEVAPATEGRCWFQMYLQPDRSMTEELVRRAEDAGCKALVLTVDSAVFGRRDRDVRNGFRDLPAGLVCENMRAAAAGETESRVRAIGFSTQLDWKEIEWLRTFTKLPIVPKGIAHPADARIAVECGADAVFVSNHGGRQLDSIPGTLELLPAVVDRVAGQVPVLMDGGVRRGTDVVKALAMGAKAVALGRPAMWALAMDGADGVTAALAAIRAELERAVALCGQASVAGLQRDLLYFRRDEGGPWWDC